MVEYYDVLYDYYGEGDAELALVLSVFSVIIGALTWLLLWRFSPSTPFRKDFFN